MTTPAPQPASPPWGWPGWALAAAAFAVGFANFPLLVVGSGLDHLPGDACDNRLNNFVLEHGYRYLAGREAYFWDAPCFYPRRGVTAWSDAHLGMLPVYAAARAIGASPERAFQVYFLVPFVLNFAAAAWAFRRLGFGPAGAAAGAYVFAFGLPLVGQLPHAQLLPRFLVPPAVVFAWEFLLKPRAWRLAAAALCGAGQVYLTVYVGYFLALLLATGFAVAAVRFRAQLPRGELLRPGRREWAKRVAAVALAALLVLPLLARHSRGASGISTDAIRDLAPVPASWVSTPWQSLHNRSAWSPLPAVGAPDVEHQLAPGLIPSLSVLLLALLAFRRPRAEAPAGFATVGAVAALLLAIVVTRFGPVWLYEPVTHVPGAGGIRVPGRIVLVLLFPAGAAVAWLIDSTVAWGRRAGRFPAVACAVLGVAVVAADQRLVPTSGREHEWHPYRYPLRIARERQERISAAIARHPNPTLVYVFPSAADGPGGVVGLQQEAMRAAQDAGVPSVNGWSGYVPAGWDFFPGYRSLMTWLSANETRADRVAGLVVVGEPTPDSDRVYEAEMRRRYPPRGVAPDAKPSP